MTLKLEKIGNLTSVGHLAQLQKKMGFLRDIGIFVGLWERRSPDSSEKQNTPFETTEGVFSKNLINLF